MMRNGLRLICYALDDFCTDEHAGITNSSEENNEAGDGTDNPEKSSLEDEVDTPTTPETPTTPTTPVDYAPAILVMKAEPHVLTQVEPLPLQNHTFIETFRNGGIDEKLRDYDSDQVEQVIEPDSPVSTFDDPEDPKEPGARNPST